MPEEEDLMDGKLLTEVERILELDRQQRAEEKYRDFYNRYKQTGAAEQKRLKDGLVASLDPQPIFWFRSGISIVEIHSESNDPVAHARNSISSMTIEYPIFLTGVEIYLKGVWLCQYRDCREFSDTDYMNPKRRGALMKKLKDFGHDLVNLIKEIRRVEVFKSDQHLINFTTVLENIIYNYYYPLYEGVLKSPQWADARYPTRYYDDKTEKGFRESLKNELLQWLVERMLRETEKYLDNKFKITEGLITKYKE